MNKLNISGVNQRKIKSAVAEIVGIKLASLDAAAGDRLIATLDAFREHVGPGLIAAIDQFSAVPSVVLKLVSTSVQLDAIASYDPKGFKTRQGLWITDDFHSRVGKKAKSVINLPAITLTSGDLVKNAYDKEIKGDPIMSANYAFEGESDFVAYLEQMISKQSNGEEGALLTNDNWNIFYVAHCVVFVTWRSSRRGWLVRTWELDDDHFWGFGSRMFSRN